MGGFISVLLAQSSNVSPSLSMGYGWALLKLLGALLIVCGLAFVVLKWLSRYLGGSTAPGGILRVVERCSLSSRQSLWVVEASGRFFLLGGGDGPGGQITKLAELEGSAMPPPEHPPTAKSFWDVLHRRAGGGR